MSCDYFIRVSNSYINNSFYSSSYGEKMRSLHSEQLFNT